ncbi:protein SLC31A2-like [Physella acuta]|uniref:protein SLC31A2-like n=1 Tax=Physella acuta TaxID=109671 RepID=UPI0027DB243A|nr:protein SLC31A2-like [Physella acuta]XP_059163030.1 protein SLC31A2-like [Physella acuta]XP_059163031.1 protein SLC31A2-like [Physella acuta]XP_059163033.1 protein SLC31A2-like [Physella acuta]
MHKRAFHTNFGDILFFPEWVLRGKKEMYLSCLVLVVMGVVYQGIKFARQQYGRKCRNMTCKRYILNKGHILQTIMYLMQFVGGYILMLSVMTYNVWVAVAVMVGLGLGYFFFGWGEYEEPRAALHVPKSYLQTCGTVSASSSATQELLSFNKSSEDTEYQDTNNSSSVRCTCGTSQL